MNTNDTVKRGRRPISGETATGQIQLRTTMERKNAYVKAAKPRKLTAWIFEQLDKASGYCPCGCSACKSGNHCESPLCNGYEQT